MKKNLGKETLNEERRS